LAIIRYKGIYIHPKTYNYQFKDYFYERMENVFRETFKIDASRTYDDVNTFTKAVTLEFHS